MLCTISQWEKEPHDATIEAVAPNGLLHYLCDRHYQLYKNKYSHPIPLTESRLKALREVTTYLTRRTD